MDTLIVEKVHVAVGVICHGDRILISKRKANAHQGGLWEFPGGKVEQAESTQQALSRELQEELGITPTVITPLFCIQHDYVDKFVRLDIWKVHSFSGNPEGREGQSWRWIKTTELINFSFPKANLAIIDYLIQHQAE